jgi:AcrR family transcriptional regulator
MARKAVAQELSRERILDEARGLFASNGYRALTMRSIAKSMGYSHGALYYHFKEKAELFYALISDDFGKLLQRQREVIRHYGKPNIGLLQLLMLEFIRFGLENPNHYEIMFMINDADVRTYSRTEQAQCLDLFASVVREVLSGREEWQDKLYTLPWTLFMSLHGFISYTIHYRQTYEEVSRLAEEHVKLLCKGLLPASKPELREERREERREENLPARETA